MCELVHSVEDCWVGVQDPKKRKQIQDRLAQRARRKRLAERKAEPSITATTRVRRQKAITSYPRATTAADNSSTVSISEVTSPMNVYSALWHNGNFLGLTCGVSTPSISALPANEIPETLRPTLMQQTTLHPLWIDRFPFPWMRDNFILLIDVVDPEDFLRDIFNMPSFTLTAGGRSWDPLAWKIEKGFQERWGFLFDQNLFDV